jgi:hypothetical protein
MAVTWIYSKSIEPDWINRIVFTGWDKDQIRTQPVTADLHHPSFRIPKHFIFFLYKESGDVEVCSKEKSVQVFFSEEICFFNCPFISKIITKEI